MKYIGIIVSIFGLDYYIKNRVERERTKEQDTPIWNGAILLRKHHNKGAILNLGEEASWMIALISVAFTILLTGIFIVTLTGRGSTTLRMGLSFLLGGAFSNTYDRLKRKYVVDYFSFGVKWTRLRNVIFNLSDLFIILGAFMMSFSGKSIHSTV